MSQDWALYNLDKKEYVSPSCITSNAELYDMIGAMRTRYVLTIGYCAVGPQVAPRQFDI